jgi:hypothetical protein
VGTRPMMIVLLSRRSCLYPKTSHIYFVFRTLTLDYILSHTRARARTHTRIFLQYLSTVNTLGGWHGLVSIATRYELDSLGIESRWRRDFLWTRPDRTWCLSSLMYSGYLVSLPEVKGQGVGDDHPPLLAPAWSYTCASHLWPLPSPTHFLDVSSQNFKFLVLAFSCNLT